MQPDPATVSSVLGLAGQRAFVVGGYGGIGTTTSQLLADAGATIAVGGRDGDRASSAAAALRDAGATDAVGVAVDIAALQDVRRAVDEVVQTLGGIDVLVNLASIDLEDKAEAFAEEHWRQVIDINLNGAFWLSQAAAQHMIPAGGGRIIHFSSTRSVAGGRRGFAAYAAAKGGLNSLVRQLATEWGQHGITVNAVGPGFVPTGLVAQAAGNEQFMQMMLRRIPMGRFGTPLEMATAVLFLAAPGGGFVNGQTLFVDGGVTASS